MNKKILYAVFVLAVVFSLAVAHAQEDESDENETMDRDMRESEIMHYSLGAHVRLLQLQKSVDLSISAGQYVVDTIENKSYNVSDDGLARMKEIISELKDLKANIAAEIKKNDTNLSVEFFVDAKSNAINLTQEFRAIVKEELGNDSIDYIKKSFRKEEKEEFKRLKEEISERIKEFNRERARELLEKLNLSDNDTWNNFTNVDEIKRFFRGKVSELTQDRKREFLSEVNKDRKKIQLVRNVALLKRLNRGKSDIERVKHIAEDSSLTYEEMRAKTGVFVKEQMQIRNQERKDMMEKLKENRSQIRDQIKDERDRLRDRTDDNSGNSGKSPGGSGKMRVSGELPNGNTGDNNE